MSSSITGIKTIVCDYLNDTDTTFFDNITSNVQTQINDIVIATGIMGPMGPTGATGATGNNGTNGTNGTNGISPILTIGLVAHDDHAIPGVTITGTTANPVLNFLLKDGINGTNGKDGSDGSKGDKGNTGDTGGDGGGAAAGAAAGAGCANQTLTRCPSYSATATSGNSVTISGPL